MANTPVVLELHPVLHPAAPVRQAGFPLDHPYLEHCWAPVLGPSCVLLLRRCSQLWREGVPAEVPLDELAAQLGLGRGSGPNSAIWHTVERTVRFRFAQMPLASELRIYTEVAPVAGRNLDRLPPWSRDQHDLLLGQHLDSLARSASQSVSRTDDVPPPHLRMAQHLERLGREASVKGPTLGR